MDWSEVEQGALVNFLAAPSPLRDALERFTRELARHEKAQCAVYMATVPRDPERAADHAAKAQLLDEFWSILGDQLTSFATPLEEPTLEDSQRSNR